ncbi:MOSC domain-containing protein [Xylanimonas protaetiae]|uniref:MOSC domain-containing protein n=1 Tax=Xylanimonas protaetiae TaxID=2509457 RepID=A0A4P6F6R3_9MICO|nr:MOSC N-terminal beta barrel domain-containing protein [Xylanimonas protaetiae]QAY71344.1 MOSC domain-containing protein [Xylanimonas protaetiae]
MTMTVRSLRRYPVKSMGGEALDAVVVDARGLVGDRAFAVVDDEGHFASGKNTRRFRRRDAVFGYTAATSGDGVVVTGRDGRWAVGSPALDAELTRALGVPSRVLPEAGTPHFDACAVSLVGTATLAWCAQRWGIDADPRRLRVNLVVDTDEPFVEETWVGSGIAVGEVELRGVERIERCRTIDLAQDGASGAGRWLKPLGAERGLCLAVYADVVVPGTVRVGDVVSTASERAAAPGAPR